VADERRRRLFDAVEAPGSTSCSPRACLLTGGEVYDEVRPGLAGS
jgi:hypothetical protein